MGRAAVRGFALLAAIIAFAMVAVGWLEFSLYAFRLPAEPQWRIWPLAGNALLMCGYAALWLLLVPRPLAAFSIAGLTIAAIGFVNGRKVDELQEPLLVFDLFQIRNLPLLIEYTRPRELALFAGALAATALAFRRRRSGRRPLSALVLLSTVVAGNALVAQSLLSSADSRARRFFDTYDVYWNPLENHRANGFALASVLDLPRLSVTVPEDYEKGHEQDLLKPFLPCDSPESDAPRRRHVVVAMLESFWDPTTEGLAFDRDPLPFYRRLRHRGAVQQFVSPVFGGATANAEFEVLTGLSTRFSPAGSIPYQQYLKRPLESLASIFRSHGYRTVAVHNFRRRFWNRDVVYTNLGFDEYLSLEDLGDVPWELGWPSDAAVFDRVERILIEADRPTFVFAVTVATHGPYWQPESAPTVQLIDPRWPDLVEPMSVYASKLALLDRHLQSFVERLDLLPDPPVVVAFGDHLPTVAAGILPSDSDSPLPRSRLVEALVLGAGGSIDPVDPRSLNCLAPEILRVGGVRAPPFFRFVEHVCTRIPVITRLPVAGEDDDLDRYRWLNYDRLFGAGYSSGVCDRT